MCYRNELHEVKAFQVIVLCLIYSPGRSTKLTGTMLLHVVDKSAFAGGLVLFVGHQNENLVTFCDTSRCDRHGVVK
jgi:hypothetical protein